MFVFWFASFGYSFALMDVIFVVVFVDFFFCGLLFGAFSFQRIDFQTKTDWQLLPFFYMVLKTSVKLVLNETHTRTSYTNTGHCEDLIFLLWLKHIWNSCYGFCSQSYICIFKWTRASYCVHWKLRHKSNVLQDFSAHSGFTYCNRT